VFITGTGTQCIPSTVVGISSGLRITMNCLFWSESVDDKNLVPVVDD
jgi:hypothetical protein